MPDVDLTAGVAVAVSVLALAAMVWLLAGARGRRGIVTSGQRATYEVLHRAGLAAQPLRVGLDAATAAKAVHHLRALVGCTALAIGDAETLLAVDGPGEHHRPQLDAALRRVARSGRTAVLRGRDLGCDRLDCPIGGAVVAPFAGGAIAALAEGDPSPGLVQVTLETAAFLATQVALAELDTSRARLAQAEVRALRAQISPHFVYNALTAIASFVRTDPERARDLILDFAEFTRYSFQAHGQYTTLAEELRSIDRYLTIERARFGDRLRVRLQIAPEVLPVELPFLCLQPLVENAVRHGLSRKPGLGTVSIEAHDAGAECAITIEDDGVGMDPQVLMSQASDADPHLGLSNVDERLRAAFGDSFGLVVETGPGAGTKVSMRVPKFASATLLPRGSRFDARTGEPGTDDPLRRLHETRTEVR
jgi:two-component system LytT family sensor kinase